MAICLAVRLAGCRANSYSKLLPSSHYQTMQTIFLWLIYVPDIILTRSLFDWLFDWTGFLCECMLELREFAMETNYVHWTLLRLLFCVRSDLWLWGSLHNANPVDTAGKCIGRIERYTDSIIQSVPIKKRTRLSLAVCQSSWTLLGPHCVDFTCVLRNQVSPRYVVRPLSDAIFPRVAILTDGSTYCFVRLVTLQTEEWSATKHRSISVPHTHWYAHWPFSPINYLSICSFLAICVQSLSQQLTEFTVNIWARENGFGPQGLYF